MEPEYDFVELVNEAANRINVAYQPQFMAFVEAQGIDGVILSRCQIAWSEAPQPLTTAVHAERDPYTNPARFREHFAGVAEAGYLTAIADDAYQLTDKGEALVAAVFGSARQAAESVTALPPDAMDRLAALLQKVVTAIVDSDAPRKACIERSRRFQQDDVPAIEQIRRYLSDLAAFRDDAHLAAWQPYTISGPAWELFSHIHGQNVWGDPVDTLPAMLEKFAFRGHDAAGYQAALDDLEKRGWVTVADGKHTVTEAGQEAWQTAETQTDAIFFQPWLALNEAETAELGELLTRVIATLPLPQS